MQSNNSQDRFDSDVRREYCECFAGRNINAGARAAYAVHANRPPHKPHPPLCRQIKVDGTDNVDVFRYQGHQAMFVVTPAGAHIASDPISYGRPQAAKTDVEEIKKITDAPIRNRDSPFNYPHPGPASSAPSSISSGVTAADQMTTIILGPAIAGPGEEISAQAAMRSGRRRACRDGIVRRLAGPSSSSKRAIPVSVSAIVGDAEQAVRSASSTRETRRS